jgi:hypothetical protein
MSDDEITWLNVRLSPDELAELEAIQKYHGIKSRSGIVRFLIHQEARRIYYPSALPLMDVHNPEAAR